MPLFEYRCSTCGHVTEFLEKAGSRGKHTCAKCGGTDVEKLLSSFAAGASAGSATGGTASCPTGTCPLT